MKGDNKSCIDLILATDHTQRVEYDSDTLQALSDHVLVSTKIQLQDFKEKDRRQHTANSPETIYKWIEGSCVQNYATLA